MKIQKYQRKASYQKSGVDENEYPEIVYIRQKKLADFKALRAQGCDEQTALGVIGISRTTYYRWQKQYDTLGLVGLIPQSKRPHTIRKPTWTIQTEQSVLNIRQQFPLWGKEKIAVILKRDFNVIVAPATVGRILNKLLKQGKILPVSFFNGRKSTKNRIFNGHAKRWEKGMKAMHIGELIQIDHMDIELLGVKHFKAICPLTKIVVEQAYTRATSDIAAKFLRFVQEKLPFPIKSIQVDGGSEFMGTFEKECKNQGIPLFVLPPRSPEYNGHVERGNATVKYEFYYRYDGPKDLGCIQKSLQKFVDFYNGFRPHQALQYLTPLQYYKKLTNGDLQSHMC